MSRSYLKNKWMKKKYGGYKEYNSNGRRNLHHLDEMPKNGIGKYVMQHCHKSAWWLEEPGSFGGHKPRKGGHRMVSGLVRARVKQEVRKDIQHQIYEK